jgi:hypothetical protein
MHKRNHVKLKEREDVYEKPLIKEIKFKNLNKKAGAAATSGCGCCGCGCGCW